MFSVWARYGSWCLWSPVSLAPTGTQLDHPLSTGSRVGLRLSGAPEDPGGSWCLCLTRCLRLSTYSGGCSGGPLIPALGDARPCMLPAAAPPHCSALGAALQRLHCSPPPTPDPSPPHCRRARPPGSERLGTKHWGARNTAWSNSSCEYLGPGLVGPAERGRSWKWAEQAAPVSEAVGRPLPFLRVIFASSHPQASC